MPERIYCQKHYLELKRWDEMDRERKLASGERGSASGKNVQVLSVEIGKRKVSSWSEEMEAALSEDDELVEASHAEFLSRGVASKGNREGNAFLLQGNKKGRPKLDQGKKVVGNRKKREKKRLFGEEVREPGRLNRIYSGPSRDEKCSFDRRKQISLISKDKESECLSGKAEIDAAPQDMGKKRLMCHQCMHSFEEDVVICSNCKTKRYCYVCLAKWYPEQTHVDVEIACPFCRGNCNCKACLRVFLDFKVCRKELDDRARLQHLLYILHKALPFLRVIDKEHRLEIEVEARIQETEADLVVVSRTKLDNGERIYCDCCSTSVVDFHRSCGSCSYDLCLACCRELREGLQPGIKQSDSAGSPVLVKNTGQTTKMHGKIVMPQNKFGWQGTNGFTNNIKCVDDSFSFSEWRANSDCSIPCPPKEQGGCGNGLLALKRTFKSNWVAKLINNAEKLTNSYHFVDDSSSGFCLLCPDNSSDIGDQRIFALRRAASRNCTHDNYLYCPNAIELEEDEYVHFQKHWRRGEPVIVRGVLERTTGLSWDPMVMWRALREKKIKKIKDDNYAVKAVDCLDWCEVEINIHKFFTGYVEGRIHRNGWPEMLKLKDWPPSSLFAERLPRHYAEFIAALPYKEYTHPVTGIMNLATRIPEGRPRPDLGPKTYIAYGFLDELGRGDSVTKLHCDISDAVNVLTHTTKLTMPAWQSNQIKELQKKYDHDDFLQFCDDLGEINAASVPKVLEENCSSEVHHGGAVWDIFRREDVPLLIEYLQKHWKEFRHIRTLPLNSMVHPIHDQTLYLNERHKKQLKEEFNVEPWTFEQYLGEAVFIPAGCPHQVRNRQSCIKVALDFVSPENIGECIRLTEEFRLLPLTHRAKEDKLEVKKIVLYAISSAVREATELISKAQD